MGHDISAITGQLLDAAKAAGADAADAIAVDASSVSIDVIGGKLEHAERSEGVDVGLRVMIGKRQACVSTSDIRADAFAEMAERAVAMAKVAPEDPVIGLADPDQLAQNLDAAYLELREDAPELSPADLEKLALAAEAAALDVKGVSQVQSASAGFGQQGIHLAASNGFSGGYRRSSQSVSCVAISGSGTGMERDYCGEGRVFAADMPTPHEIGTLAGERAVERVGATKPPTGTYPVVFDERVASSLIGHLGAAINGSSIVRGGSWARDMLGKQILPKGMDLIEDPHRARISGSRPFDAEGLPTTKKAIVEDGILQNWTLDLATARKLGLESTGNAVRGTNAPPSPSLGNLWLTAGQESRADLLRDMGTGLLVTSMIGSTINPNTGDYSRGAAGFWVENGEIQFPVNECTIAGNLIDMLQRIRPANDARDHYVAGDPIHPDRRHGIGRRVSISDLDLIVAAAKDAGAIAHRYWQKSPETWDKADGAGPVTEADLAVDSFLKSELLANRPDYGWLSEETEDDKSRLNHEHVYIVDPIDGTRSFIAGETPWAVSIAVAQGPDVVAGAIYLPAKDLLYAASLGHGATLNGTRIATSQTATAKDATVLAARPNVAGHFWRNGQAPAFTRHFRPSLAYRLALVAEGRFDAMLTLRAAWEWDIAAGALIATEAGAKVSNWHIEKARFNNPHPQIDGVIVANPALHRALADQLAPVGTKT